MVFHTDTMQLFTVALIAFSVGILCSGQTDVGNGILHKLNVLEDVWLERSAINYDNWQWLIVGKHPQYPKKRSLLRFEDVPRTCKTVNHATMYLYYRYSHKPTSMPVAEAPFITRTIQAHRILKYWKETEATTTKRHDGASWSSTYLGIDGTDADYIPTGETTIHAGMPAGFVGIEVTSAVKGWKAGICRNYGLLIWATNEDQNGRDIRFYSKSYSDSSKHPYILVNCN